MQRRSKGPRLWLAPEERRGGRLVRPATWIIRDDGARKIRTGCTRSDRKGAERKLADYIARKYQAPRESDRHPAEILILDVLNIYAADAVPKHRRPNETMQRLLTLGAFPGWRTLADVNGKQCRAYVAWRMGQPWKSSQPDKTGHPARKVSATGARRELEDLRAAINHHRKEGLCSEVVGVALPDKGEPRDAWLTRNQAAQLLWAAWRAKQVMQGTNTKRDVGKHVARFILTGLYTGTRHAAICGAAFQPAIGRGHVDLDRGVFHRRAQGVRETKKRQPPVRLPNRLLAHLRRWHQLGIASHAVVEWNGKPASKGVRIQRQAVWHRGSRHPAYPAAHGSDVGDAERRRPLADRRLPRHDARNSDAGVRPPSPGLPARCRRKRCAFTGTVWPKHGTSKREQNEINGNGREQKLPRNQWASDCTHRSGRGGRRFKSCHSDQLHTQAAELTKLSEKASELWTPEYTRAYTDTH